MGIVKAVFRISKKFTIERDLLNSKMQCSGKKTSDVSSRFFVFFFFFGVCILILGLDR